MTLFKRLTSNLVDYCLWMHLTSGFCEKKRVHERYNYSCFIEGKTRGNLARNRAEYVLYV
ncbi:hypothetical protein N7447_005915 [Penicillium robsamsonii]|uniref:uncharacterized protein n=1 Tax=Penicillium robsamsonii TaxID=1792511 RepID=UPI002546D25D|nr:uncharacterized protein N7447_005915 [Penicillium robsamsonii]KAJ5823575.1 hypothetical protein N7447_005915 [Penicillium robsamsonii]